MKNISLIVAVSENGIIGNDNQLLWHLPNDLKRFKSITMNKPIIMGRKTFESIGKPLPGRQNIILTRARYLTLPGCDVVHSVNEALDRTQEASEIMIIGGAEIYQLFYPLASKLYLTLVHSVFEGNVHFIAWNPQEWQEISRTDAAQDDKHAFAYSFIDLERK